MASPFISVIVTDYQRKKYLRTAIESALSQKFDKDRFEVIVVTGYEVHSDLPQGNNLKYFICNEKEQGGMLAFAVEKAKGSILSFLDDDDRWMDSKLSTLYTQFSNHDNLGYYHNNLTAINESGEKIENVPHKAALRRIEKKGRFEIISREAEYPQIRRMVSLALDFNSSCISVRREVALKFIDEMRKVSVGVDSFLFYSALMTKFCMVGDSKPLTEYRVHSNNLTGIGRDAGTQSLDNRLFFTEKLISQLENMIPLFVEKNEAVTRSIQCSIADNKLILHWLRGANTRKVLIKDILIYVKHFSRYELKYNLIATLFSLICLASPRLAKFVFKKITHNS